MKVCRCPEMGGEEHVSGQTGECLEWRGQEIARLRAQVTELERREGVLLTAARRFDALHSCCPVCGTIDDEHNNCWWGEILTRPGGREE